MNIRPYADVLRKQGGWRKTDDSRAGGCRVVNYEKAVDASRRLALSLWEAGGHNVSFYHDGMMATYATAFDTVPEMLKAIAYETTRPPVQRDARGWPIEQETSGIHAKDLP
jgi:hypothetical protein